MHQSLPCSSADKESRSPFLYYQSKSWMPECLQGSINTVHCSRCQTWVDTEQELWLSTNPCVSTLCLPNTTAPLHMTKPSRPSPSAFEYCKWSKTGGGSSRERGYLFRILCSMVSESTEPHLSLAYDLTSSIPCIWFNFIYPLHMSAGLGSDWVTWGQRSLVPRPSV